ncbi:MAG TPA: protoporphyrinogen oxidase [Bacteroidota bacterium]|nr:protoporphyrinogen oxidase [Bacteroidota bacterium]
MKRGAIIIGGGISGLMAAHELMRAGVEVTVLERESAAGGTMRTVHDDGWLVEAGPNSALETTPLFARAFDLLGIAEERLYADPAADRRYILRKGRLHPLPLSPGAFLGSSLWSTKGKLRLLKEPFIGRADHEETIAQFVERRLGREFLDYAINPFVAGVYAGDPTQLSVRAAFPKLYALEERYGGLVRGMIGGARERRKRQEKAKDRAKMFSFRDGMETLPRALARALGPALRLGCHVTSVGRPSAPGNGTGFEVQFAQEGSAQTLRSPCVVVATPAHVAGGLIRSLSGRIAGLLEGIYYPPVAEVFLGFRREEVSRPLDGFGFLVPEVERRMILGTIWSSSLFPGRAPSNHVALTSFVGGSRQSALAALGEGKLIELVMAELRSIMGISRDPVYAKIMRWDRAIPQYNLGYLSLVEEIAQAEESNPGLYFCANFRGGIAVGDCLMSAEKIAGRIAGSMSTAPDPTTIMSKVQL